MSQHNLADVFEAIAAAVPDREAVVWRDRRLTYRDLDERSNRLARCLHDAGFGLRAERADLEPWESGQDHLAVYLLNGNEYLEATLASFKARLAPFNVNYRYTPAELVALLRDTGARAVVYHEAFAPTVEEIRGDLPELELLIQVADGSGHALLEGAIDYASVVDEGPAEPVDGARSADDLYLLCTGGTTGAPKAVLWRQADIFEAVLAARRDPASLASLEAVVAVASGPAPRQLPASPFMHGSAQWFAFVTLHSGGTVVLPDDVSRFDAADVVATLRREHVHGLSIVGDAFARPLLEELTRTPEPFEDLRFVASGGAVLTASVKDALMAAVPGLIVVDTLGSSETGAQGQTISMSGQPADTGSFALTADTAVLDEERTTFLDPGDPTPGWLARVGAVPLGYLGDAEKTRRTFPVVDGRRCSIPGDRVVHRGDGTLGFVGRDSMTINTGGEKVFAEEVEAALKEHHEVDDAIVIGRPSERWGQEVVALVQPSPGCSPSLASLHEVCGEHLARYKHPKAVLLLDQVERTPAGKPDYRWARDQLDALPDEATAG